MSEEVLERLNQILAAQGLPLKALVDIEAHLGGLDQGEEAQEGAVSEPRSMAPIRPHNDDPQGLKSVHPFCATEPKASL